MTRPPTRILGPADISDRELEADTWARESVADRITRIRTVATAWGATVTAITGLFGLGTLAGADAVVAKLQDGKWPVLFGLTALGAILCAAASLYFASRAAQPSPVTIPVDVGARAALYEKTFTDALKHLERSRMAALAAVVILVACIGIRWYAPQDPPATPEAHTASVVLPGR